MNEQLKIVIAGDLFPTPINYKLFSEWKTAEIFDEKILKFFNSADYRLCNLDGCFTSDTTKPKHKDVPNIRAPIWKDSPPYSGLVRRFQFYSHKIKTRVVYKEGGFYRPFFAMFRALSKNL